MSLAYYRGWCIARRRQQCQPPVIATKTAQTVVGSCMTNIFWRIDRAEDGLVRHHPEQFSFLTQSTTKGSDT